MAPRKVQFDEYDVRPLQQTSKEVYPDVVQSTANVVARSADRRRCRRLGWCDSPPPAFRHWASPQTGQTKRHRFGYIEPLARTGILASGWLSSVVERPLAASHLQQALGEGWQERRSNVRQEEPIR